MNDTIDEAAPVDERELTNCPACDGHVLFTVELDYDVDGGYRPDYFDVTPEQGDTITRCDGCGAFFVHVDGNPPVVPTNEPDPEPETELEPAAAAPHRTFPGWS